MFRIWLAVIGVYSQHEGKTLEEAKTICRRENVIAEIEHSSQPRKVLVSFNPALGASAFYAWVPTRDITKLQNVTQTQNVDQRMR
jgi:hypothetical protein